MPNDFTNSDFINLLDALTELETSLNAATTERKGVEKSKKSKEEAEKEVEECLRAIAESPLTPKMTTTISSRPARIALEQLHRTLAKEMDSESPQDGEIEKSLRNTIQELDPHHPWLSQPSGDINMGNDETAQDHEAAERPEATN